MNLDPLTLLTDATLAQPVPPASVAPTDLETDLADERSLAAYRQTLELLAEDELAQALTRLGTLEQAAMRAPDGAGLQRLEESQARVLATLVARDADLYPVLALHARAIERYRFGGLNLLARHTLRWVSDLADLHITGQVDLGSGNDLADLLVEVAIGEAEFQNLAQAIAFFEQALTAHEDHPRALLGLASVYERQGRYADVIAALDKLSTGEPSILAEGALRLGVNLARRSETRRARRILTRLVEQEAEPWIARLAYQELARFEMTRNPQDAIEMLTGALTHWPGDFHLAVQLAYCLDSTGRPREALKILRAFESPITDGGSASARWLYHHPPSWSQRERWASVATRARQGLPSLRAALEAADNQHARR